MSIIIYSTSCLGLIAQNDSLQNRTIYIGDIHKSYDSLPGIIEHSYKIFIKSAYNILGSSPELLSISFDGQAYLNRWYDGLFGWSRHSFGMAAKIYLIKDFVYLHNFSFYTHFDSPLMNFVTLGVALVSKDRIYKGELGFGFGYKIPISSFMIIPNILFKLDSRNRKSGASSFINYAVHFGIDIASDYLSFGFRDDEK